MNLHAATYDLALAVMAIGLVVSFLPFVPGPPVVWLGALLYGWQTQWQGIGRLVLGLLFIIALAGSTSEWWLGILLHREGGSLWTTLGSFVGGLLGSAIFPVLGTVVGALSGVLVVELVRFRDIRRLVGSGRHFVVTWLLSTVVEILASAVIIGLFTAIAH